MVKKQVKKILIISLGVFFILVGLAGLVLPVLQGWLFLAIGGLLLSMYSPRLRAWIDERTSPYPRIHGFIKKAEEWTTKIFGAPEV